MKKHMLQSNLPCAFTSKKLANKRSCGVHALAVCAGPYSAPFASGLSVALVLVDVSVHSFLGDGIVWAVLDGQLVMPDAFVQVRKKKKRVCM